MVAFTNVLNDVEIRGATI